MFHLRRPYSVFFVTFLGFFLFYQTAYSGVAIEHEAKAADDECFCGIGDSNNGPISNSVAGDCSDLSPAGDGATSPACTCSDSVCGADPSCTLNICGTDATCIANTCGGDPTCLQQTPCIPKVNENYPWGLTKVGPVIWLGTFDNVGCAGGTVFFSIAFNLIPSISNFFPISIVPETVCEFEFGPSAPLLGDGFGDQRPPSIYTFNTQTNTPIEEKSVVGCKSFTAGFTAEQLLAQTVGLRSAGSLSSSDIFIFAGSGLKG